MQKRDFLKSLFASMAGGISPMQAWAAMEQTKSLHEPIRYVFLANKSSYLINIIDIETGEYVETLNLGVQPDVIEMARDEAMLAIATHVNAVIYFHHLQNRTTHRMDLPSPVYQIFFIPQSKTALLALRNQVGIVNYENFSLKVFDQLFDWEAQAQPSFPHYVLAFSSINQSIWALSKKSPQIFHSKIDAAIHKPWEVLNISKRAPQISGFDIAMVTPDDEILAMTSSDGRQGMLYYPEKDRLFSTGIMSASENNQKITCTPYIDAYAHHVIFANTLGEVALFDVKPPEPILHRFKVDFSPRVIRSGWLESTWILGGEKTLMLQLFDEPENRTIFRFPSNVVDMWVTSDGKTLLFTLDKDKTHIHRCDIRSREMLPPLGVQGFEIGAIIRMGSSNSICY